MADNIKKELSEIETLREIKKNIQMEIDKLQITLSNLQAQEHTAQVKAEQDSGIQDVVQINKYAAEERRLEIKRIGIEQRISLVEELERKINDREREVEKREQKLIDLEGLIADLNKQRANFEEYKTSIEKELEQAKITIVETNAVFEKIEAEKQVLTGREVKVKGQEKYWNDLIGELEEEKKKFQIEKENLLGLTANKKEEVNA